MAPFVQNPSTSRLYDIHAYRGHSLDAAVDEDIINVKIDELHNAGELIECGYQGARWPADEYCIALVELARKELGWSEDRMAPVRALWK